MLRSMRLPYYVLCLFVVSLSKASEFPCSVMSYNIRLNIENDGINQWPNRKAFWLNQVAFHHPDFIGVQEAKPDQMQDVKNGLNAYASIGVGRDDGFAEGEYSAIFYNKEKWKVLTDSTFWLSPSPDTPSIGWDAAFKRICTYGNFENLETGERLWVFNTHLDHIGSAARANGVKLILSRIQELVPEDECVFLTGDFNATPDSEPIELVKEKLVDTREICDGPVLGPLGTFNGFNYETPARDRIDYIFTIPNGVEVIGYATLTDAINCRYPSDHFPIIAHCRISIP